ncbi:MAG: tetratricopeptide repeat protein [Flammeovirgaceae bacterium]
MSEVAGKAPDIDSLLQALSHQSADTTKARLFNELSTAHWYKAPDTAFHYAQKALALSEMWAYAPTKIQAYRNLGVTYWVKGDYLHALEQFHKMLKLSDSTNNLHSTAQAYNNLAMVYKAQEIYSSAIQYYKRSLSIHQMKGDTMSMAIVSGNLGAVYLATDSLEESLRYNFEGLKLAQKIGRNRTIGNTLHNIGEVYVRKGWYQRALDYFKSSLDVFEKTGEAWSIAHAENGMAKCYIYQNKLDLALSLANKSYQISQRLGAKELIKESCENLTKIYEKKQDFKKAFEFQQLYHLYTDSLINEDKNKAIHQLELQQKDAENRLLRKQAELQELSNDRKSIIIFSFAGALVSSIILAIIFFRSRQRAKKLNIILKIKNSKIQAINKQLEAKQEEIEQQNHQLKAQRIAIAEQRDFIKERNEQITKSITAAKTIQQAMLPYDKYIKELLKEYFILYKPKDIVSGDFYWFNKIGEKIVVAAIDCTGHGVPGAFMSMIGNTLLDNLIALNRQTSPADILRLLNDKVTELLQQRENNDYHGMDAGIVTITYLTNGDASIVFSGAKRPLYFVSSKDQTLGSFQATNKSIGGRQLQGKTFENQSITLPKGSMIYLSSDGFEDQHNRQRRKVGRERLSKLLQKHAHKPVHEQQNILEEKLTGYMKEVNQRDDILVIGIKV